MTDFAVGVCVGIICIKAFELFGVSFWWSVLLAAVPYFAIMSVLT